MENYVISTWYYLLGPFEMKFNKASLITAIVRKYKNYLSEKWVIQLQK